MIIINTKLDDVFHEAEELLRLFLGMMPVRREKEEGQDVLFEITIDTELKENAWQASAYAHNTELPIQTASYERIGEGELLDRRARSRAVKFALFRLMKLLLPESYTPWGSLTGIRPTKLLYEYMARGMSADDAGKMLHDNYGVRQDKVDILLDIERMQRGVRDTLPQNMLDVYIGIPFCPSRCEYCSFASCDVKKFGHLRPAYMDALLHEMQLMREYMEKNDLHTGNLYIGGGTPTALEDDQLLRLLDACGDFKPASGEFTLEAGRPDTITESKLLMAKDHGVSRISINPQSMHDITLERIGRRHMADEIEKSFALARGLGFDYINMDLIAGLTGETPEMFASSLDRVMALSPENITVHTLSIKRSSILHENLEKSERTAAQDVDEMVQHARRVLKDGGWYPYYLYRQKYMSGNLENVGYAKEGTQCIYNVDVMEETHSNLAMGAGAITKWFDKEPYLIRRAANVKNVQEYIARSGEMAERKMDLAREMFPHHV